MIRQISALAAAALTILLAGAALAADPTATTDCFTCSTLDMMQQLRDQFARERAEKAKANGTAPAANAGTKS